MKTLSQIREATGDKAAYQAFFRKALKKFGVTEPDQLKGDKEKEFYDYIDAGWEGDNEKPEKNEGISKSVTYGKMKGKKKKQVDESCGKDHSKMTGTCPECGKELSEEVIDESMGGLARAMNNLSDKPEFKKIKRNLKSLSMRATETHMLYSKDKKKTSAAAKQIKTQLAKLASKVDKKAGAKLTKMSGLAATYEEVEEVFLKKGRGYPGIKADKKKKNKRVHGANKTMAYDYDRDKRKEEVEESVSVDMRTRGFKSAMKRNLLRKEKAQSKKKSEIDEIIDATNRKLRGEDVSIGAGSVDMGQGKPMKPMARRKKKDKHDY